MQEKKNDPFTETAAEFKTDRPQNAAQKPERRSYYYDDAYGYETFVDDPDDGCPEEDNQPAAIPSPATD